MASHFIEKMNLARSIQHNIPYGSGRGLLRSGEQRSMRGGFVIPPALIAAGIPVLTDVLKRPINKLFNWLGMGAGNAGGAFVRSGGSLVRSGGASSGFWQKPGDIGSYIASQQSANNASFSSNPGDMSSKDIKNLHVLEYKLGHLTKDPEAFYRKLSRLSTKDDAYFKTQRKRLKKIAAARSNGDRKYKYSKRFRTLKAKYYKKHGKTGGKYHKSAKYKAHKAKYTKHFLKKKAASTKS